MKANSKVYGTLTQQQADTDLRSHLNGIKKELDITLHNLEMLMPRVCFENNQERERWCNLVESINEFRALYVSAEPQPILQLRPDVKKALVNLWGTDTELGINRIVNDLLKERINLELNV